MKKRKVSDQKPSLAFFPVWFLATRSRDGSRVSYAVVNGQTGKVSVRAEKESIHISLPWWLEAILLFIVACGLVFGIGWLLSGDFQETLAFTGLLGVFYLFIFCFMFFLCFNVIVTVL